MALSAGNNVVDQDREVRRDDDNSRPDQLNGDKRTASSSSRLMRMSKLLKPSNCLAKQKLPGRALNPFNHSIQLRVHVPPKFLSTLLETLNSIVLIVMASSRSLRPLAHRVTPHCLPRLFRPYSAAVSKNYENLLISTPKPGVGLSTQPPANRLHTHAKADVADLSPLQSPLTAPAPSMPSRHPSSMSSTPLFAPLMRTTPRVPLCSQAARKPSPPVQTSKR